MAILTLTVDLFGGEGENTQDACVIADRLRALLKTGDGLCGTDAGRLASWSVTHGAKP